MTCLRPGRIWIVTLVLVLACLGCASMRPATPLEAARLFTQDPVIEPARAPKPSRGQTGWASFYGPGFHGRTTASGETYDQEDLTAAHPTLEFGSRVRVTNLANGETVVVRVTDRGPYVRGRIIDLSVGAARELRFVERGVTKVRLEPVS
ncbi:MAG TPA: septal ring lytic transglycosylase RlpA family protein [Candidatus Eisenbacteria bacterium]|nr:septal ring lytic transglycosylase RlpA family protein [Candidatus Eisenbacteria bacterium]